MGDHFVLLVDRLLTESTLEAAIESRNRLLQATTSSADDSKEKTSRTLNVGDFSTPRKLVECRICQDEDLDTNMETPCSCCGSLKYAHRHCVQRWCNKKGNIVCEICHQQFKPNYTAPPPLFQIGRIPLNFRGSWETSRRDFEGARVIAMVSTDRAFLNPNYDEHPSSITRNAISFRLVALMFMVLLIARHALPVILDGTKDVSFPLVLSLLLRTAGIILPICVMMRLVTALQRRRNLQESPDSSFSSIDEEAENSSLTAHPHIIDFD